MIYFIGKEGVEGSSSISEVVLLGEDAGCTEITMDDEILYSLLVSDFTRLIPRSPFAACLSKI